MESKLTTAAQRLHVAHQIIESVIEPANTMYYVFFGDHNPAITPKANIAESYYDTLVKPYFNMIGGKKATSADLALAIRNIPYVTSTTYDMYDDQDVDLATKDYFVITDEGSYKHVYKCLDNNNGTPSSIQPSFAHVSGSNSYIYQTSDGYRWKYMYSVSSSIDLKFSTSSYFPIVVNTTVETTASYGTVDIIKVEGQGQKYDNYVTGTFSTPHIQVSGNSFVYEIANSVASTTNNFYSGCLLYISSGTGSGQYTRIDSYYSNSTGKYVVIANTFLTIPTNGSQYEIYPRVDVVGSGLNTVNCVARALVNSFNTNSVYRVEVLNRGANYTQFSSANVYADAAVGVNLPAELRIINAPPGGHGANTALELSCNSVMFSVKISNNEGGTIPATNSFKQVGILKDPVFANVALEFNTLKGTFVVGERVVQINPIRVDANVSVSTATNIINSAAAAFDTQFDQGDYIFLESSDGLSHQLGVVDSVSNTSEIVLTTNGLFVSTLSSASVTETYSSGYFVSANGTHVLLANVSGQFLTGDQIVGLNSGAWSNVASVSINGVQKGFDTFVQMYKYTGVSTFGSFNQNEYVRQANTEIGHYADALVHSANSDGSNVTIFVTSQSGEFRVGGANTMTGNTSGAVAVIDAKYPPDLITGSGHTLFVENIDEVARSNTTSETIKVLLSF
jgi:hypothetical protein